MHIKKATRKYTACGAAVGGRSRKDGQSRYFIGYKKHTLRLWLRQHSSRILLAPLISWAAPASRGEALFLEPSLRLCERQLDWVPDIVVGDMSYINLQTQRRLREERRVALLTKFRPDMILPEPFEEVSVMTCDQGQVDVTAFN